MSGAFDSSYHYQLGGSLPANAPSYVVRQADRDLYKGLVAGDYCYVLNARQMGKSSLRLQAMSKLQAQSGVCTEIELSGISSPEITSRQWYGGIIQELISGLGLQVNRRQWLADHTDISPVQSLGNFIETVLLEQIKDCNIYIFIDEIDSVLSLDFSTDEFFALIRNCYDKRASHPEYRRLSFAMIGVATPSELIQNERSTPFNIGRAIALQGFTLEGSQALVAGLVGKVSNPQKAIREVLAWTGGQPFLTQKLCCLLVQSIQKIANRGEAIPADISSFLADLVKTHIIKNWEGQDDPEHLRTIRDRILRNSSDSDRLLKRYRTLLRRGSLPSRNTQTALELRLSGLVVQAQGQLTVRNRIYQTIFNQSWVNQQLRLFARKPQIALWKALALSTLSSLGVIGIRSVGILQATELQAFDHLMRTRPEEAPDQRLLLITVTEEDVQAQPLDERGAASLSDSALQQLLQKLEQANPRVIGLDIYRDAAVKTGYDALTNQLATNERLYVICQYGNPGVLAPPEVPVERQTINNVALDTADSIARRQILGVSDPSPCGGYYSFNLALAADYLDNDNIELSFTEEGYFKIGETVFNPLEKNAGGYHNLDVSGHQVLLNYRASPEVAPKLSLGDVLSDRFDPSLVKDRVVIIGTVASSFNDNRWVTPHTGGNDTETTMTGMEVQAHMVSQILSATQDDRPLIWWWSEPSEASWIIAWSAAGGLLMWQFSTLTPRIAAGGVATLILYGSCWFIFQQGGWIPLVPAFLGGLLSGGGVLLQRRLYLSESKQSESNQLLKKYFGQN